MIDRFKKIMHTSSYNISVGNHFCIIKLSILENSWKKIVVPRERIVDQY